MVVNAVVSVLMIQGDVPMTMANADPEFQYTTRAVGVPYVPSEILAAVSI